MKAFDKFAERIATIRPNSDLLLCIEKTRNPSLNVCSAGCSFNKDISVCDLCKADQPIDVYETDVAALALANGYVKIGENERVLPVEAIQRLAYPYCATCREEGLSDCRTCEITELIGGCHE